VIDKVDPLEGFGERSGIGHVTPNGESTQSFDLLV
jgi:hypothetical protein